MKRILVVGITILALSVAAQAHLCNDVFVQAKDNLVVKVDVRDGQLRISKTGSFRVYLLNTMDRDIDKIQLDVITNDFDANTKPADDWRGFPRLRTATRGGKKEYFDVELTRKKGTREGKYKIALHLHGGGRNKVFKTVDINDAMALMTVPEKPKSLKVDGKVKSTEWKKGLLCASFYEYKRSGRYMQNFPATQQTRFRFFHEKGDLYCCVDFQKKSKEDSEDKARIFISKDQDSEPKEVVIDIQKKEVTFDGNSEGIETEVDSKGTKMEIKIPVPFLALEGDDKDKKAKVICVNLVRECGGATSYWRGNSASFKNPVVFANFVMGDK